jgi:large subunit ribosomal protein L4
VALRSALSSKLGEQDLIVLDSLQMAEPKTKAMARILENLKATRSAFLVIAGPDENVMKSARNIAGVKAAPVGNINVYDVLKHKKLVLTKDAVAAVEEVLA